MIRSQITIPRCIVLIFAIGALLVLDSFLLVGLLRAGVLGARSAVGGVMIDPDGVVSNATEANRRELQAAWQAGLEDVPAEMDAPASLRFVSLRGLEHEIARHRQQGEPIPDSVKYLAGLQRVQYVLVYPERGDIVLAGPAEGWRVDSLGSTVGVTSGRPVLLLEDLMAALRSAGNSGRTGISCSIDPTPEGLQRASRIQMRRGMRPEQAARQLEQALGDQIVSVTGVPGDSHFACVMVAADFRMKRLAMNFEPAPVDGLPSYLQMARASRASRQNMLPRWWLAANYEPLRCDEKRLAWEIRGQGVKCLTEQDMLLADGQREHTGKAEPVAQRWADAFTDRFDELAREDSTFGHLRNLMDLAVVAALVNKEGLIQKTDLVIPRLMGEEKLQPYNTPRRVASQASFIKKSGGWIISASGGVQMDPWYIADQTEVAETPIAARDQANDAPADRWWWNSAQK